MLLDMNRILDTSATRAHQEACAACSTDDDNGCKGPDDYDRRVAAAVLDAGLVTLTRQLRREVDSAMSAYFADAAEMGPPDATAVNPEELLLLWFRWWRDSLGAPTPMPHVLHVRTGAYLTARAVAEGRVIHTPNDV